MKYDVKQIAIGDIDTSDRLRPSSREAVEALALDIKRRGLRNPVEVSAELRGKFKYRLVTGFHRLEAYRDLGLDTIPAYIVSGNRLELRRDELMENLARNELSALERCQFVAELKRIFEQETGAQRGGDRRSTDFQASESPSLGDWYAEVAVRSARTARTIRREAAIGERLDPAVADRLRGSAIEDKQVELEALGKFSPHVQVRIADQLLAAENPAPTVKSAVRRIEGHPEESAADAAEKAYRHLLEAWNRAPQRARKRFLAAIGAEEVAA